MKKVVIFILVVIIIIGAGIFVAQKFIKNDETKPVSQGIVNEPKKDNVTENNDNAIEMNNVTNNEADENNTEEPKQEENKETKTDEEKAIDIVKKEWGADNSVNFVFDYKDENGNIVIVVRDSNTTAAIEWYIVDLATGTCKTR